MKGVVSAPPVFHFNIWQLYFNIDLEDFNPRSATYILLLGNGRQVWFSSLSWMSWCSRCVHYIINFKSFANYKENSCKYLECTLAFHYTFTHWTPIKTLDLFLLCFKYQLAFCCCVKKYFSSFLSLFHVDDQRIWWSYTFLPAVSYLSFVSLRTFNSIKPEFFIQPSSKTKLGLLTTSVYISVGHWNRKSLFC